MDKIKAGLNHLESRVKSQQERIIIQGIRAEAEKVRREIIALKAEIKHLKDLRR